MDIIFMCLFHMNVSKLKICRANGSWVFIWVSHSGNCCLFYSKCILKFIKQLISLKLHCFIGHINSTLSLGYALPWQNMLGHEEKSTIDLCLLLKHHPVWLRRQRRLPRWWPWTNWRRYFHCAGCRLWGFAALFISFVSGRDIFPLCAQLHGL